MERSRFEPRASTPETTLLNCYRKFTEEHIQVKKMQGMNEWQKENAREFNLYLFNAYKSG